MLKFLIFFLLIKFTLAIDCNILYNKANNIIWSHPAGIDLTSYTSSQNSLLYPVNLETAFAIANLCKGPSNHLTIRLHASTYTIKNKLLLTSYVSLEGGYYIFQV